jgi:hypothetical protein
MFKEKKRSREEMITIGPDFNHKENYLVQLFVFKLLLQFLH